MYWLAAVLFLIGAVCGATVRLMAFIGVLLCAAVIAASVAQGWGGAALNAVVAIVTLQVGYAAGFVLRAAIRSRQATSPARVHGRSVTAPIEGKRR